MVLILVLKGRLVCRESSNLARPADFACSKIASDIGVFPKFGGTPAAVLPRCAPGECEPTPKQISDAEAGDGDKKSLLAPFGKAGAGKAEDGEKRSRQKRRRAAGRTGRNAATCQKSRI